ncbi:MAG: PAS domain-containing sensor histidine kinase [Cyclobacteriaceae bacterium]
MELVATFENDAGFRALFEYATIGIVVVDSMGRIVMMNPNSEELFGYQQGELIGKEVEVLIPSHLHHSHRNHRDSYIGSPRARPMGAGLDLFALKKDGTELPVEISLCNYKIDEESMAVAFISDISERKKAEKKEQEYLLDLEGRVRERTEKLEKSLRREHELNELKSRFVSLASHEFRTPLSSILSSASILQHYHDPEHLEKREKHIERIKSSVKNLTEIMDDFLSLDKLEQEKIEQHPERFSLVNLIEETTNRFEEILKPGQKIVAKHVGSSEVFCDPKLLRNVLINLLSNASKYSKEDERIELKSEVEKKLVIQVIDHGIGIPKEDQKALFGLFFRANNVDDIQGTGLGLNIVKKYLELMGGTIHFESVENKGSTFKIALPAC